MTNPQTTIPTSLFLALCEESVAYHTLVQDWLFEERMQVLNDPTYWDGKERVTCYDGCSDE